MSSSPVVSESTRPSSVSSATPGPATIIYVLCLVFLVRRSNVLRTHVFVYACLHIYPTGHPALFIHATTTPAVFYLHPVLHSVRTTCLAKHFQPQPFFDALFDALNALLHDSFLIDDIDDSLHSRITIYFDVIFFGVLSGCTLISSSGTSNGQAYTTVVQITSTVAAGSTVVANKSSAPAASHTGAIVGGVIGGIAFLAIVAGVLVWLRRRSRYRSEFDGNFDPARVTGTRPVSSGPDMIQHHTTGGTLPRMDIGDDEDDGMGGRLPHSMVGGGIVTPFAYTPAGSAYGPSTRSQSPPMPSGSPPPMSQYSQPSQYSQDTAPSSVGGYYTAVPQQAQAVGGYYPPPPPSSSGSSGNHYNPRSAKEREAAGGRRSGNFAVANPSNEAGGSRDDQYRAYLQRGPPGARRGSQGEYMGGYPPASPTGSSSGAGQRTSGVLVHQDGGRLPEHDTLHEEADEIPPTYDSLPSGERKQ
ncbi:hypothetical protein C8R47DRAFT_1192929 [Mycena vitilis]|nr:hypothetical protein C8R47DRAFT_1192929 [Mycena vitilis]